MKTQSKTLNLMFNIETNTKMFVAIPTFKIDLEIDRLTLLWGPFTLHIKPITI